VSKAASDNAKRKSTLQTAYRRWAATAEITSQAELARLSGLSPPQVTRALSDFGYGPSQATLDKMLKAMGFEAEVVLKEVRT
jgi:DNA-binding phage protein